MTRDSIYPEFLKNGIGKLEHHGAHDGELVLLFSALENFRRDLAGQTGKKAILELAELYVLGLELFEAAGFLIASPSDHDFQMAHCAPSSACQSLEALARQEIQSGRFSWALRQSSPVCCASRDESRPRQILLHTLNAAGGRIGMFIGSLKPERANPREITLHVLSMLLSATADTLASVQTMEELQQRILAADRTLKSALEENQVLARFPAESPNPVVRLSRNGQILYSNESGRRLLEQSRWQTGDLVSGNWMTVLEKAFQENTKQEFDVECLERVYAFLVVPVPEAGYANFYGTDNTARRAAEAEREKLIEELRGALQEVKVLSGLVPICSWCKKVRDDTGYWEQLESYIQTRSAAVFTHGICPDCQRGFAKGDKPKVWSNHSFDPAAPKSK